MLPRSCVPMPIIASGRCWPTRCSTTSTAIWRPRGRLDLRRGVLEAVAGSAGATFRYGGRRSILAPRARRQPEQGGRCAAPAGRSCRALDLFHASRAISQRLADADPTNAGLQRDLSISLNKVGDVLRHQGDLAGRAGRVPRCRRRSDSAWPMPTPRNAVGQRDLERRPEQRGRACCARRAISPARWTRPRSREPSDSAWPMPTAPTPSAARPQYQPGQRRRCAAREGRSCRRAGRVPGVAGHQPAPGRCRPHQRHQPARPRRSA